MTEAQEEFLTCVEKACATLDAVEEHAIIEGDAAGLLVMHGLAMYARETARAASSLLRAHQTLSAAALSRVVIEHAVLAQWLKVDPEPRAHLFLQQSEVEHARWFEVVLAANFDSSDLADVALATVETKPRGAKPKNVAQEFDTVKNLFGNSEGGRQLYLTYRNLSRFVHPSAVTFWRYTNDVPIGGGRQLVNHIQAHQDPEAVSFYLASATIMCALPYLDVSGEHRLATSLRLAAQAADVLTALN